MQATVNLWHPKKGHKKVKVNLPSDEFSWNVLMKELERRAGVKGYYIANVVVKVAKITPEHLIMV